ncbi:CidA/LrgA family protein [Vibrio sp. CAU 1672]|uniref:CidA/LrgA family protein n=1 Tax=Vibrio sp. CAU 1672 TaxID=3032594 RepID=UPI0023DB71CF|nr:CidA/LrgA family protein [Vibrio sp. CAU 1672]MDF2152332.1 CidA/LrgA family protein [Vibrio sp. CAU 1672]
MIKPRAIQLVHLLISLMLILGALGIGNTIQQFTGTSVPGSVIGMLVLFFSMTSGVVKVEWVRLGATLFIRYMILLFVPISVGLMQHFEMLLANALPIIASAVGGSLIVLVSLAWLLDYLLKEEY